MEDILNHYEHPVLTEQEVNEQASEHLWNYLCGDGNVQHLYDYYECIEKN